MKYNVGDRVRIKSLDWYNRNKNEANYVDLAVYFTETMAAFCGKVMTITDVRYNSCYNMLEDSGMYYWIDDMIEGPVEEKDKEADIDKNIAWLEKQGKPTPEARTDNEPAGKEPTDCEKCELIRNSFRCLFIDNCPHNKQKNIIEIPKDCVIKDENDNIINTTKIVLEKKKRTYPKSLAECLEVLGYEEDALLSNQKSLYSYNVNLLIEFQKLIICRDAYWKIAGEGMGLGKPWEPDYSEKSYEQGSPIKYVIYYTGTHIARERKCTPSYILTFPTEEMRDAFYENFKDLIENCKELYC